MIGNILKKLRRSDNPTPWTPPPSTFDEVYNYLLAKNSADVVIFDVGSHHGESIERFRDIIPNCIVHSFEPDSENFKILQEKYAGDDRIFLNNFGIADKTEILTFHRYAKSDTSSFVEVDKENVWTKIRSAQANKSPEEFETKAYEVEVRSIDEYIRDQKIEHVHLVKLDTQGFEDKALIGAASALQNKKIDYVELELIVKSPYKTSLLFRDIENLLLPKDYHMYGIGSGSNYFKTYILQFDLLFARSECYLEGPYKNQLKNSDPGNGGTV